MKKKLLQIININPLIISCLVLTLNTLTIHLKYIRKRIHLSPFFYDVLISDF
jgi:hypothetical protein